MYTPHTNCRACNSTNLTKYLNLGKLPLANNLENTKEEALNANKFPLEVVLCEECGLSQLSCVVDPKILYNYYTYRSGVNGGYIEHCRKMAKEFKEKYSLDEKSLHVDIASNDGTLLKEFKDEIGLSVLGVDPSTNLTAVANSIEITSIPEFWGTDFLSRINLDGEVDLITATNVFAHVNDIKDFLIAARIALKPTGKLVIECPYIVDHIEKLDFTQVYFEHLSYMSVHPIYKLCKELDLELIDVEHQDIHSGTIRMTISHASQESMSEKVFNYLKYEKNGGFRDIGLYNNWSDQVEKSIALIYSNLNYLKSKGHKIAGFAASAKGNTLLNSANINHLLLDYIIDDTPEKISKFSPGTGIPIIGIDVLQNNPPDYLLILSFNFRDEIIKKVKDLGYKNKFIIPIPTFEIID